MSLLKYLDNSKDVQQRGRDARADVAPGTPSCHFSHSPPPSFNEILLPKLQEEEEEEKEGATRLVFLRDLEAHFFHSSRVVPFFDRSRSTLYVHNTLFLLTLSLSLFLRKKTKFSRYFEIQNFCFSSLSWTFLKLRMIVYFSETFPHSFGLVVWMIYNLRYRE